MKRFSTVYFVAFYQIVFDSRHPNHFAAQAGPVPQFKLYYANHHTFTKYHPESVREARGTAYLNGYPYSETME